MISFIAKFRGAPPVYDVRSLYSAALNIEDLPLSTITLTGNHGYTPYKVTGLSAGTTIDAETASWIHDNNDGDGSSNAYPFQVYDAPGVVLDGGTIDGNIDLTKEWRTVYNYGNSAAIRTEDTPNVVIRDWRITDTWDAVRVSWNSPNFLIEDVWVTNARDDAVENDRLQSGTIRDSLFDGVFGGISVDPSSSSPVDGHNNTVTLDGVLMRMKSFMYEGEMTHSSMIKTDSATPGTVTPNLRFINTVFAIEDVEHRSYRSMADAWSNTVESKGNVFLNLSDTPLPSDYPKPPAGWTILQGQAARDYWNKAKADWIARHEGTDPTSTPPQTEETDSTSPPTTDVEATPEPETNPTPTTEKPTFSSTSYTGSSSSETIIGNDLANKILAKSGDDVVKGGLGNDTIDAGDGADAIWGGAGNDIFVFGRGGDMDNSSQAVDIYMDFTHGADKLDFKLIDANGGVSGDQTFAFIGESSFGTNKAGQVRTTFDATKNVTRVELNTDNDSKSEYYLTVSGKHTFTAADFIL